MEVGAGVVVGVGSGCGASVGVATGPGSLGCGGAPIGTGP